MWQGALPEGRLGDGLPVLVDDIFPRPQHSSLSPLFDLDVHLDGIEVRGVESARSALANHPFELSNYGIPLPVMLQKVLIVLFQLRFFLEVPLLPVEGILYFFLSLETRMYFESVPPSYSSEGRWELETCRWELEGTPFPRPWIRWAVARLE